MIKYTGYAITFEEVPDEVSLCITISNCPFMCDGCHSPELRENIGGILKDDMKKLLDIYKGRITCVCFMGDGQKDDYNELCRLFDMCRNAGLKVAQYSGYNFINDKYVLDYIKIGPYMKDKGGLAKPTTNQRMYRYNKETNEYDDITYRFHRIKS